MGLLDDILSIPKGVADTTSDGVQGLLGSIMPSSAHAEGILSDPNRLALLQAAGKMMEAGGTGSPYKGGSWARGLGAGVQGYASGLEQGQNNMLKQQLVQGQLTEQKMKIGQLALQYQNAGQPVPAWLQSMVQKFGGGSSGQLVAPQAAIPGRPGPSVGAPPAGAPASPGPQGAGAPNAPGSGAAPPQAQNLGQVAQGLNLPPGVAVTNPDDVIKQGAEAARQKAQFDREHGPQQLQFEQAKLQDAEDQKTSAAVLGQATAGQNLRNMADRTKYILQNPNMATAPFANAKELLNQIKVATGADPTAMAPQEQVKMMAAQEMLNTMRETASSYQASGEKEPRWFQSMVETLQNTLADPSHMSLPTLQNSMERMSREGGRDEKIGREMLAFKKSNGGKLGDDWKAKYLDLRSPDVFDDNERKAMAGLQAPPPGSGLADLSGAAKAQAQAQPQAAPQGQPIPFKGGLVVMQDGKPVWLRKPGEQPNGGALMPLPNLGGR